jgi:phosphoglycolate phosphatase-like HAD superfamily hydrolase
MAQGIPIRMVLFDFDGTLADTIPICVSAYQKTFERHCGRTLTQAEVISRFGPCEEGMLERDFPGRSKELVDHFLLEYERAHAGQGEAFPGIRDVLLDLRAWGAKTGIVTGKGPGSAAISMRATSLADLVGFVETGSPAGDVKAGAMSRILSAAGVSGGDAAYVGDSPGDMVAARVAGVLPIGAAWTPTADAERLREAGADRVFAAVPDMHEWLRTRFSGRASL